MVNWTVPLRKELEILTLHSIFFCISSHFLMLHRFEIHSSLKLSRTALLCCASSRGCSLVISRESWHKSKKEEWSWGRERSFLLSPPPPPSIFQFLFLSPQLPSLRRTGSLSSAEAPAGYPYKNINNRENRKRVGDDGKRPLFYLLSSHRSPRALFFFLPSLPTTPKGI